MAKTQKELERACLYLDNSWAKIEPYKTVEQHASETAMVARVLLTKSIFKCKLQDFADSFGLSPEETLDFICFLVSLHDLGKIDPYFQCKQEAVDNNLPIVKMWKEDHPGFAYPTDREYHHELGSKLWIVDYLDNYEPMKAARVLANCIRYHHQRSEQSSIQPHQSQIWEDARRMFCDTMAYKWNPNMVFPQKIDHVDTTAMLLLGILVLSDWLSSSALYGRYGSQAHIENVVFKYLENAHLTEQKVPPIHSFAECWGHKFKFFYNMQKKVEELADPNKYDGENSHFPYVVLLESPPGSAKTESALYVAIQMMQYYNKAGVYFALPTMATANGMFSRVGELIDYLDMSPASLAHGQAWIQKQNFTSDAESWFNRSHLRLLMPSCVGTIDQAMSSVLQLKYIALKLLGLSNKVLIIDEIHSYDDYMLSIVKRLLEFCKEMNVPVVCASATLPILKKRDLLSAYNEDVAEPDFVFSKGYPLITVVESETYEVKEYPVTPDYFRSYDLTYQDNMAPEEIAAELVEKYKQGGNVMYLANTVKRAQFVTSLLESMGYDVLLYHARYSSARREEIEKRFLELYGVNKDKRPERSIIVTTQVGEQSLDFDVDYLITDVAPIDLLVQRMGRVFRHANTPRPAWCTQAILKVVISEEARVFDMLYDPEYVNRTEEYLHTHNHLNFPDDIREAIEFVYHSYNDGSLNAQGPEKAIQSIKQMSAEMARSVVVPNILPKPTSTLKSTWFNSLADLKDDDENTVTRLGEKNICFAIIPNSLYQQYQWEVQSRNKPMLDTAKKIMTYAVTCRETDLKKAGVDLVNTFQEGSGLLCGTLIAKVDQEFKPTEDFEIQSGKCKIKMSAKYGLLLGA